MTVVTEGALDSRRNARDEVVEPAVGSRASHIDGRHADRLREANGVVEAGPVLEAPAIDVVGARERIGIPGQLRPGDEPDVVDQPVVRIAGMWAGR